MHSKSTWDQSLLILSYKFLLCKKRDIHEIFSDIPPFLLSTHHLHFYCCFLSCSDSCFYSGCLICLILRCYLCWKTGFCYLNLNNSLPCSFSFLLGTALLFSNSKKTMQNIYNFFNNFFKKDLHFYNVSFIIKSSRICLFSIITPY